MKLPRHEDYPHFYRMAVRWGDMDQIGHVNNAKFFTYAESARIDYFKSLIASNSSETGGGVILARIACDFLVQLHFPAQLEVGTRVLEIGRSSLQIEHAVFCDDTLHGLLRGTMVWFDYATQRPTPVPESARAFIRAREQGRVREAR